MKTTEKTLTETLKRAPWQLGVRLQHINTRMSGQGQWMQGSKHYRCEIWREGFGTPTFYVFEYSQGPAITKSPSMADLMWSLLQDASIAQQYDDVWEMAKDFGYMMDSKESYKSALATYETCEKINDWLTDTFSSEELEQLYKMFEDY